jgi:hypothetical protein
MAAKGGNKQGGKKRKFRVKKSVLSDLNKREINWRDWAAQFVALLPLLESDHIAEDFARLRESVEKYTGRSFDGTVPSWRDVCTANAASIAMVRMENPLFFESSNAALFKLFGFPTPKLDDLTHVGNVTPKDVAALVMRYRALDDPRTPGSTKVKALWLLARVSEDDHLAALCRAFLSGNVKRGGEVRIRWSTQVGGHDLKPNIDWAAEFISWGLGQTPCLVDPYEPPEKPPWPVNALEPIAATLDVILGNVLNLSNEPVADRAVADTLSGLLARTRDLVKLVRDHSARNEGMAAEIMTRCLADTAVQIKWLLFKNDPALFQQFQERSLASEKGVLDDLRERLVKTGVTAEAADKLVDAEYADLFNRAGKWPELFDVVYGPWSDISTTQMFKELPDSDEAWLAFQTWIRSSDSVHGSWRSVEKYQLSECQNPLHVGHHNAISDGPVSGGITPVLSSMFITLNVMSAYASRFPQLKGLGEAVERQRLALREWVAAHQLSDGSFIWHDSEASEADVSS